MNRTGSLFLLRWLLVLPLFAGGASNGIDPEAILRISDRARGDVEGLIWTVRIVSMQGGKRQQREMKIMARGEDALAEFISPARMKGHKLLMVGRNMWFMKPGLSKPVPISPRQRLLGGVSNADIASTHYAGDYHASLLGSEMIDGEDCVVLNLRAKDTSVTYSGIKYWVSKKRKVGIKAEFFAVSGKVFKSALFEYGNRLTWMGKTSPFVSKMVIRDALIKESVTTLTYRKITVTRVPDAVFNLNLLVN